MSTKRTEIVSGWNDVFLCATYYEGYKAADHDDTKYIPKTMVEFVLTAYVFQAFGTDWVLSFFLDPVYCPAKIGRAHV